MRVIYNRRHNPKLLPVHISRCGYCYHWEQSQYIFIGKCRIYPHNQTNYNHKCENWSNIYEWLASDLYFYLRSNKDYCQLWQKKQQEKNKYRLTKAEIRKNLKNNRQWQ